VHIKYVHENHEKIKLHKCDAFFHRVKLLKKHIDAVHEKKKTHLCSLCGSCLLSNHTFSNSGNLNAHIASVHEGKKPKKKYEEEKIGT